MGPRAVGEAHGEEACRGREKRISFCGRDTVKKRECFRKRKKNTFYFFK